MFTAVAIAQLAQAGRLSFDDTISKHLPDYPNKVSELGYTSVVLMNSDPPAMMPVIMGIRQRIPKE
jgi:CubicO group peptidase (beta-lactamase class C family)